MMSHGTTVEHRCDKCYLRVPASGVTEESPKTKLPTTQPFTELEKKIDKILEGVMDDATLWYIERISEEEYWQTHKSATKAILTLIEDEKAELNSELLDALENHKKTLDYIVKGAPRNPTNYEVYLRKAIEVDSKIATKAQGLSNKERGTE
jgi:hypothetical protein